MNQLSEEQKLIEIAEQHAAEETSEYRFACTVLNVADRAGMFPNGLTRELRQQQTKQFIGGVIERLYGLTSKEIALLDSDSQVAGADDAAGTRDEWKAFAEECKEGIRASHRVLDELGVPREDAWLQETDGKNYGIEEVVEYPVHERIKMLPPLVATAMRDKCVEKVKKVAANNGIPRFGKLTVNAVEIVAALQFLTLDQVKPGEK